MATQRRQHQLPDIAVQPTDVELVEAASRGDIDSFGELCQRHYAGITGLAYCILSDRHLAEDAAQEALAVACRDLRRLRTPENFGSWLRGIVKNGAKSMARRRARLFLQNDLANRSDDRSTDNGSTEAVRQAVRQLPKSYREAVVLRYFSGLSYEEIATVLNISPRAVNGRLTRAKRKLAERLRCNGFGKGVS